MRIAASSAVSMMRHMPPLAVRDPPKGHADAVPAVGDQPLGSIGAGLRTGYEMPSFMGTTREVPRSLTKGKG